MERRKPQILTAAIVLVSVTVLSFGVRHVRMSMHRARVTEEPASSRAGAEEFSGNESITSARNTQQQERVDILLEEDMQPIDSDAEDAMTDSEEAIVEAKGHDDPGEEKQRHDAVKRWDKSAAFADKKYSKKSGEDKKGVEYVPMKLSDTETLYTGKSGEYWYVQKLPDGKVTKMQMQEVDGELQPVGEKAVYDGDGGQGKSGDHEGK